MSCLVAVLLLGLVSTQQAHARVPAARTVDEIGEEFSAPPLEVTDMLSRDLNSRTITKAQHDDLVRNVSSEIEKATPFIPRSGSQEYTAQARRLQEVSVPVGSDRKDSWAQYLLPPARDIPLADPSGGVSGGRCTDPLATQSIENDCVYDCEQLKRHYFGESYSVDKTRCFIFVPSSAPGAWPIEGDWPAELIDRKSARLDWWPLVPDSVWEDPPDGTTPLTFEVGRGAECRNVTFVRPTALESEEQQLETELTGRTPVELNATHVADTICLYDGIHYETVANSYSHVSHGPEERFQHYEGELELGECTEIVVRVISDPSFAPDAQGQVTWTLSDGSGQSWDHTCGGTECVGQHEYFTCLYDHEFTLARTTANDDGWSGTVEVHTYVPDNTIRVPVDENWIIQGYSVDGVPVELDARLASGDPWKLTAANLVLRHVRFSGQPGTLDIHMTGAPRDSTRGFSQRPWARMGQALYYEGGFDSVIVLDHVLLDHNGAISGSGGAFMLAGRSELNTPERCANGWTAQEIAEKIVESQQDGATEASAYPPAPGIQGCGLTLTIVNSTGWANSGFVAGVLRAVNVNPITQNFADNVWVDNDAIVGGDWGFWYYNNMKGDHAKFGNTSYTVIDDWMGRSAGGWCTREETKNPYGGLWCGAGLGVGLNYYSFQGSEQHALGSNWNGLFDGVEMEGSQIWYHTCGLISMMDSDGIFDVEVRNLNVHDNAGIWETNRWQLGTQFIFPQTELASGGNPGSMTMSHSTYTDNQVAAEKQATTISTGGHIFIGSNNPSTIEYSSFTRGHARTGSAIFCTGPGSLVINECTFQSNRAFASGGAITFESSIQGGSALLLIQNSVFNDNQVVIPVDSSPTTAVFIRVYTGSMGLPPGGLPEDTLEYYFLLPVFKIDGAEPAVVCGQSCTDGEVPSNEVVYGSNYTAETPPYDQEQSYSTVVHLSPGTHTLWYGTIVHTSHLLESWVGGAWIDVVDIVPAIYPAFSDYRSSPDTGNANGYSHPNYPTYAVAPACWSASAASAGDRELCPTDVTLWRKREFVVPFGEGGAIFTTGTDADVRIIGTTFNGNAAGTGTVLKSIGSAAVKVKDSLMARDDTIVSTAAPDKCGDNACALGEQCTLSDTNAVGYFCGTPCGFNEYGDGYRCQACPAGTEPGCNGAVCDSSASPSSRNGCIGCPPSQISTQGVCNGCPAQSVPDESRTVCVPCDLGLIVSADGAGCEACPAGKTASADGTGCDSCILSGVDYYSTGQGGECARCETGKQPNQNRTSCLPCPLGTQKGTADSECKACDPGQQPSSSQSECNACVPGKHSVGGSACTVCPPGSQPDDTQSACERCVDENAFSADGEDCSQCPVRMAPNADRTACACKSGTYENTFGVILCEGVGSRDLDLTCIDCPDCLICDDPGNPKLSEGYAFFGQSVERNAYRCPAMQNGQVAGCPGGPLQWHLGNLSDVHCLDDPTVCSVCAPEYTGPICGSCSEDFSHLKVGKPCVACEDGRVDIPMLLGVFVAALLAGSVIVSGGIKILQDHGIVTDVRLVVGFYQILGQIGNVVDIELPEPVPQLASLVKILFLDVRNIIKLDCWDVGGFHGKLVTNLLVIPVVYIAGCIFIYTSQIRTISQVVAAGAADESAYVTAKVKLQRNLFLGIFLLYPTVTATLFRVPQCREIGDTEYHEEDFAVECVGPFWGIVSMAVIGILVVPVGVPLVLFIKMKKAKDKLGGAQTSEFGGAKLSGKDVQDEDDTYGFLTYDLKPAYWYYEIVTFTRKLVLGGLSIVVGRGSMAQAYFVASTEALFLMHHMRVYPYVIQKHNVIDGVGHCALMLTYMVTLVLRRDQSDKDVWAQEWFPRSGYGYFIAFFYVVLLPAPSVYYYFKDRESQGSTVAAAAEGEFDNPLTLPGDDADIQQITDGVNQSSTSSDGDAAPPTAFSRVHFARTVRISKEVSAENAALAQRNEQLTVEVDQLRSALLAGGGEVDDVAVTQQLAAKTGRTKSSKSKSEPEPESASASEPHKNDSFDDPRIRLMKAVIDDESQTEENRTAAKALVDQRVTHAIDIQKRQLVVQQSDETLLIDKARLDMLRKRNATAFAHAQSAREELRAWLGKLRLIGHEDTFYEVCGADVAVADLIFCRQEDLDQLSQNMSYVETARLTEAIKQLTDASALAKPEQE